MIGTVENYVASRLHALRSGERISVDNFLATLITELTVKKHDLQAPFKGIKAVEITPDASLISQIVLRTLILNQEDAKHLASALTYQLQMNKWILFVTTDETEILSREQELFEIFALQCSSPEWASDYYSDMTKLKAPIEYFREIRNYSNGQREFAETVERIMGIKIMT
jgi:mRNA-degrading endonuclease YafQ of YafQ-DinJ toxin-antitoxin module